MSKSYFEIIRPGINSTFQDLGRFNQHHIGIPLSGVMDKRNYLIGNKLVGNNNNISAIEFAYQGPLLKFNGDKITITVTGDVIFKLNKKNNEIEGRCYETYQLENGDEINILSTKKSVYGYLAISGEFDLKLQWGSCSINTKANIGSNDGKKLVFSSSPDLGSNNSNWFNDSSIHSLSSVIPFSRIIVSSIKGRDIDALARLALWSKGKDYAHGTGHGVGSVLSVHEP